MTDWCRYSQYRLATHTTTRRIHSKTFLLVLLFYSFTLKSGSLLRTYFFLFWYHNRWTAGAIGSSRRFSFAEHLAILEDIVRKEVLCTLCNLPTYIHTCSPLYAPNTNKDVFFEDVRRNHNPFCPYLIIQRKNAVTSVT